MHNHPDYLGTFLTIIVNYSALLGLISGLILIGHSLFWAKSDLVISAFKWRFGRRGRFFLGCGLIVTGFFVSLVVNVLWELAIENVDR